MSTGDAKNKDTSAADEAQAQAQARVRQTAIRHATDIELKKKLMNKVADLVVTAFDLPSAPDADPAHPAASDAVLFKQALGLFAPSDLDDLIYERNVDSRCGYALCPRPNHKTGHDGKRVWNGKGGKETRWVDKAELERWCSKACQERTTFVRAQLGKEPAWLRIAQAVDIQLLDEMKTAADLATSLKALSITPTPDGEIAEKLRTLALERGELNVPEVQDAVPIVEHTDALKPKPPSLNQQHNMVEGLPARRVRFS